jgi:hypothetical protein
MLANTPEWVGDATAWLALATSAGIFAVGVARWVNRGLDVKIGHAMHDLKGWIKGQFDADRAENDKRWALNSEQHAAVVKQINGIETRLSDTEAFLEHQIDRGGFRP